MIDTLLQFLGDMETAALVTSLLEKLRETDSQCHALMASVAEYREAFIEAQAEITDLRGIKARYEELERANAAVTERMRKAEAVALHQGGNPLTVKDSEVIRTAGLYVHAKERGSTSEVRYLDMLRAVKTWRGEQDG